MFLTRPVVSAALCAVSLALLANGCSSGSAPATAAAAPACRAIEVPVTVPHVPERGQITGDLCLPRAANGVVLLLVAGGGENADYWNMPGLGSYSFVDAATKAGYATFAVDRLGTGRSTIPAASSLVTYDAQVATIDQVAGALRNQPSRFGAGWKSVVGVGHSLGSGTLAGVAANHPADLDAAVLTGYGAAVTPETVQLTERYQAPARTLSRRWAALDPGYLATLPDAVERIGSVYGPDTTASALAIVGAHQGTVSITEVDSRPQGAAAAAQAARIRVPVLVVDGQYDRHYCEGNPVGQPPSITPQCAGAAAFATYERHLLPNACLATSLIEGSGHAIQEERAAPRANALYLSWLTATMSGDRATCARTGPTTAATSG